MSRIGAQVIIAGVVVGLALGCGPSNPSAASGGGGDPGQKPAADGGLSAKTQEGGGGGAPKKGGLPSLPDLLGTLPKEKWPASLKDSLRTQQAGEWYKANVEGKRASWTIDPSWIMFTAEGKGKWMAYVIHRSENPVTFLGLTWDLHVIHFHTAGFLQDDQRVSLEVRGLSEQAAERIRAWPKGTPLEVTFKVSSVTLTDFWAMVFVEDVAFAGVEP